MGITNIFIAKLVGILFILSGFVNFRKGRLLYLNLKKGDLLFTVIVVAKIAVGVALILLPQMKLE